MYEKIPFDAVREYKKRNSYYKTNIIESPIEKWISLELKPGATKILKLSHFGKEFSIKMTITQIQKMQIIIEDSNGVQYKTEIKLTKNIITHEVKPEKMVSQKDFRYFLSCYHDTKYMFCKMKIVTPNFFI